MEMPASLCLFMKRGIMPNKLPCSRCGVSQDIKIVERVEQATIKGKVISYNAMYSQCCTCGDEFLTSDQLDANLHAAHEAYALLYEAPSPEALVTLRECYNASQKAFSIILGFGELTMNSYENGGTPDSTNRLLLKLSADPYVFRAMYEINSSRIGAIQRRRIEESAGFKAASSWEGLPALSLELTELQRDKIKDCANHAGRTISEQVAFYVGDASFRDYSTLMEGIKWSNENLQSSDIKCDESASVLVAS